jgi:hypothetical protein
MADSEQKPEKTEKTEKTKPWSLIREIVQFISTLLAIIISLFTINKNIRTATDSINDMETMVKQQSSEIQSIREALVKNNIIQPK